MLARATEIEGHPDNVAAAIYGGFVSAAAGEGGEPFAARFDPPEGLEGIVVIPPEEVSTAQAREAIPAEVPLADAVANVSAAALLVLGPALRRPRPGRPRPRRPHPPAAPPRALPALDGDRRRGARAGRAGGDDLRRRPDRARLDHLAGRRQRRRGAAASAAPAGPRCGGCRSARSAPTSPSSMADAGRRNPAVRSRISVQCRSAADLGSRRHAPQEEVTSSLSSSSPPSALFLVAARAAASATIAFVRGFASQTRLHRQRQRQRGEEESPRAPTPHVSPDGASLAYLREGPGHSTELKLAAVGGGAGKTLMTNFQEPLPTRLGRPTPNSSSPSAAANSASASWS